MSKSRCLPLLLALAMGSLIHAQGRQPKYRDYFGTFFTTSPRLLHTTQNTFRWGVTNPKPLEMAYFAGTFTAGPGPATAFQTSIHVDEGVKAPLEFTFRKDSRNGDLLETVQVRPGQTLQVRISTGGARTVFVTSEVKIQHDKATRIILGEPQFGG